MRWTVIQTPVAQGPTPTPRSAPTSEELLQELAISGPNVIPPGNHELPHVAALCIFRGHLVTVFGFLYVIISSPYYSRRMRRSRGPTFGFLCGLALLSFFCFAHTWVLVSIHRLWLQTFQLTPPKAIGLFRYVQVYGGERSLLIDDQQVMWVV